MNIGNNSTMNIINKDDIKFVEPKEVQKLTYKISKKPGDYWFFLILLIFQKYFRYLLLHFFLFNIK